MTQTPRQSSAASGRWLAPVLLLTFLAAGGCALWQVTKPAPEAAPPPVTTTSGQSPHASKDVYRSCIYGGLPKTAQDLKLLQNKGYLVGYSEKHKDPAWVAYRLFKVEHPPTLPRPTKFSLDVRTLARVKTTDYTNTGYDRGHMAPNHAIATRYGEDAQLETFLLSNICPQKPNLNRKVWEHLEATEADDYANRFEEIWVIDGPIFNDPPEKLPAGVDVPRAFFKILVDEVAGRPRMLAFIMPQGVKGDEKPRAFLTSVQEIEKETGLDFFSDLPKEEEQKLEAETARDMW